MTEPETKGPRWLALYERLAEMAPGEIIKKDEVIGLAGTYFGGPLSRAKDELLAVNLRTVLNIRSVGWRVAAANEHVGVAETMQRRASSTLRRGVNVVSFVRRDELTDTERSRNDRVEMAMQALARAFGRRFDEIQDEVDELKRGQEELKRHIGLVPPVVLDVEPQEVVEG